MISLISESLSKPPYVVCASIGNYGFRKSDNGKQSKIGNPSNSGLILEHITALTEVRILSINHSLRLHWNRVTSPVINDLNTHFFGPTYYISAKKLKKLDPKLDGTTS